MEVHRRPQGRDSMHMLDGKLRGAVARELIVIVSSHCSPLPRVALSLDLNGQDSFGLALVPVPVAE